MSNPVDRATARIAGPMVTPEEMVSTGNAAIAKIQASPALANAPDVAAAVKAWATATTNLGTNNTSKTALEGQLAQVRANEPQLVRRWGTNRRAVLSAIDVYADGSKEVVATLGADVEERTAAPDATTPQNLRPMKTKKPQTASARWDRTPGARGYMLQHASDPTNPATYSTPASSTMAKCHLLGQTTGAVVYFRVAALDPELPGGQTAFTAWVAVSVY